MQVSKTSMGGPRAREERKERKKQEDKDKKDDVLVAIRKEKEKRDIAARNRTSSKTRIEQALGTKVDDMKKVIRGED